MRFAWACLIFIYVLHYPLSQMLPDAIPIPQYDWSIWLVSYGFVIISSAILMLSIYMGMFSKPLKIVSTAGPSRKSTKRMGLTMVIMVFTLFGLWTYWMVNLKIGITIYADFDQLPFRITGILFYGRLLVQPLVLAYIATVYATSKSKWLIFLLLILLGSWVSITSGSRYAAIMFALPLFVLFKGRTRYMAFGVPLLIYIVIASLSRTFYLPEIIGDVDLIRVYGSDLAKEQDGAIEKILLLPLTYIAIRVLGMREVLATLNFGNVSPSFLDSVQSFLAVFLPFIPAGNSTSFKVISGGSDADFGGVGLDLFSMAWVSLGGSPFLYMVGLALIGWLLGRTYLLFAIGLERFGLRGFTMLVFVMLFILLFQGQASFFPMLFITGWLFSRKSTSRRIFACMGTLSIRRVQLPTLS